MLVKTFENLSQQQLIKIACTAGKYAKGSEILLLSGDLGAGKTVFAKALAQGYGVAQHVTSPTFTLINTYETERGKFLHLDLYRIEEPDEIAYLGFDEYYDEALIAIEWPQRLPELPMHYLYIEIIAAGETHRTLHIKAKGIFEEQLLKEMERDCLS